MLRKILKFLAAIIALLLIVLVAIYIGYNKKLPDGESGPKADELAYKMLDAVNNAAFEKTRFLEWSFRNGAHLYKWDKELGIAEVSWDNYKVILNLNNNSKSVVHSKVGEILNPKKSKALIDKAIDLFNNDSFWLVAPFKVFDTGTERRIVKLDDNSEALLITYTTGGSTPGDSYLWKLQPNGFPESFQMWVSIIPLGGVSATWDDWQLTESGAFLPKTHQLGPVKLEMGEVRGYTP